MDIKELRQLVKLMVDNDLSELDIINGENKVFLKRGAGDVPVVAMSPTASPQIQAAPAAPAPAAPASPAETEEPSDGMIEVRSPMVGTFYAAPSPDSDAYVQVGASIGDDTVVCIVEAMKVMNEIKAECSGTIAEVCVKNAQPVEFNQVLFRVKPS